MAFILGGGSGGGVQQQLGHMDGWGSPGPGSEITRSHWMPAEVIKCCTNPSCAINFEKGQRKHHCRCCGNVYCSECTAYVLPLNPVSAMIDADGVRARVCILCYERGKAEAMPNGDEFEEVEEGTDFFPVGDAHPPPPESLEEDIFIHRPHVRRASMDLGDKFGFDIASSVNKSSNTKGSGTSKILSAQGRRRRFMSLSLQVEGMNSNSPQGNKGKTSRLSVRQSTEARTMAEEGGDELSARDEDGTEKDENALETPGTMRVFTGRGKNGSKFAESVFSERGGVREVGGEEEEEEEVEVEGEEDGNEGKEAAEKITHSSPLLLEMEGGNEKIIISSPLLHGMEGGKVGREGSGEGEEEGSVKKGDTHLDSHLAPLHLDSPSRHVAATHKKVAIEDLLEAWQKGESYLDKSDPSSLAPQLQAEQSADNPAGSNSIPQHKANGISQILPQTSGSFKKVQIDAISATPRPNDGVPTWDEVRRSLHREWSSSLASSSISSKDGERSRFSYNSGPPSQGGNIHQGGEKGSDLGAERGGEERREGSSGPGASASSASGHKHRFLDWSTRDVRQWLESKVPFIKGRGAEYGEQFEAMGIDGLGLLGITRAHPAVATMRQADFIAFQSASQVARRKVIASNDENVNAPAPSPGEAEEHKSEEARRGIREAEAMQREQDSRIGSARASLKNSFSRQSSLESGGSWAEASEGGGPPGFYNRSMSSGVLRALPSSLSMGAGGSAIARTTSLSRPSTVSHSRSSSSWLFGWGAQAERDGTKAQEKLPEVVKEVENLKGEISKAEERETTVRAQLSHLDDVLQEAHMSEYLHTRIRHISSGDSETSSESENLEWVRRFVVISSSKLSCYFHATDLKPQTALALSSIESIGAVQAGGHGEEGEEAGEEEWSVFQLTTAQGTRVECATKSKVKLQLWLVTIQECMAKANKPRRRSNSNVGTGIHGGKLPPV